MRLNQVHCAIDRCATNAPAAEDWAPVYASGVSVPQYHHSRRGRVFRLERRHDAPGEGVTRYLLRAVPVRPASANGADTTNGPGASLLEVTQEFGVAHLRDKLAYHQDVPTPELIFENLWQRLRLEIDAL